MESSDSDGDRSVADGGYEVSHWEPRTALDRVSVAVYGALVAGARWAVVALALLAFTAQVGLVAYGVSVRPTLGAVTLASIVPALLIVGVIWYEDDTMREPLWPLAATFLLSVLFASFAAFANTALKAAITSVVPSALALVLFFFLVVGPVEEFVKWLAVRLYAYRTDAFDAVIDGAVYGAVAGLGFATIENALYISRAVVDAGGFTATQAIQTAYQTATVRSFAGPGHVLYSAIAGYYLGLAKFTDDHWGPIVVKGLLVAAVIHATYNTLVSFVAFGAIPGVGPGLGYVLFVLAFQGVVGYVLYRKIAKYNRHHRAGTTQATAD